MRTTLVAILAFSFFLLVSSFAGMSFFAMSHEAMMDIPCINHCLDVVQPDISPPVLTLIFLTFAASIIFSRFFSEASPFFRFFRQHWRQAIGKFLLHQHLSTIVLRD